MSYPVGWDLVNITGTYIGRNGVPCVGSVTLSSPQLVLRSGTIVPAADIVFDLVNGVFFGQIPATDDPNAQPSGWTYTVTENVPGGRQGYQIVAPHTSPGIDLSTVIPVTLPMPPTFGFPYITLSQLAGTAVGNGAYLVGYQNTATGSVARTVQDRLLDALSVFDFLTMTQITDTQTGTPTLDLTAFIQSAVNQAAATGKKLLVNSGTYGVSVGGAGSNAITVPSNSVIEFEPGASLFILGPFTSGQYQIINVSNATNVTLIRPSVNGNNANNGASTGLQNGTGIYIGTSSNVLVQQATTLNTWGDGIYIGQATAGGQNSNITIDRHHANGVRRNGVSLITGTNVHFRDCLWENITGTSPKAGIDIEPNDNTATLQNITVDNCHAIGNGGTAFQVALHALPGTNAQVVDIRFNKCTDTGSNNMGQVGALNTNGYVVTGKIVFTDCVSINAVGSAFYAVEYDALGPAIQLARPTIINPNTSAGSSSTFFHALGCYRASGSPNAYAIGNFTVTEPTVILTTTTVPNLFTFRDVTNDDGLHVVNCHFHDPVQIAGFSTSASICGYFSGLGTISDKSRVWTYQLAASGTLGVNLVAGTLLLPTVNSTITLPSAPSKGAPDWTFMQTSAVTTNMATASGGNFQGQSVGTNLVAASTAPGATITLRPLGSNVWMELTKSSVGWSF